MDTGSKIEDANSNLSPLPSPALLSLSPVLCPSPLPKSPYGQDLAVSPPVSEAPPLRWLRPTPILSPQLW